MELEKIYSLTVGQLRELLAYACADETIDSFWEDITDDDLEGVGYDEDEYEDDDYEDEDDYDDCDDEEEEDLDLVDDEVCEGGCVLANPEEEELAQSIANDIRNGCYTLDTISNLYSDEVFSRVYDLI